MGTEVFTSKVYYSILLLYCVIGVFLLALKQWGKTKFLTN